jgi:hypothetical protein
MSNYPRIAFGLGKLTPELWSRLMRALQWVEQVGPMVELKGADRRGGLPPRGMAQVRLYRITDALPIAANRWEYGWERMMLEDIGFVPMIDMPTHESNGFGRALNLEEAANTPTESGFGISVVSALGTATPLQLNVGSIVPGIIVTDESSDPMIQRPLFMPASNPLAIACALP